MSLAPLTELFQDGLLALAKETALPNWDGEGAQAIPMVEWTGLSQFVASVRARDPALPLPEVAPCGDGTIHLVWWSWRPDAAENTLHVRGSRLLIEWRGSALWWSRRSDRRTEHGAFASNEEALEFLLAWWRGK